MLIFILLIFISSSCNIINAESDESSENVYIDRLPEKEKREFLERVARRILEEVKSSEAAPGAVSGEIPDEQLKLHSDYVTRLLKEETKNLKRRNQQRKNNDTLSKNDTSVVKLSSPGPLRFNIDDTERQIEAIERAVEKLADEKQQLNQHETLNVTKDDKKNEKGNKDDINADAEQTLREGDEGKGEEVDKVLVMHDRDDQEKIQPNDANKAIDLTLRNDDIQKNNPEIVDLTLRAGENVQNNSNNETSAKTVDKNVTEKDKTNISEQSEANITKNSLGNVTEELVKNITKAKPKGEALSIEISFVDDPDYKEETERSTVYEKDKIPVKVVYDKNNKEEQKQILHDIATTNKAPDTTDSPNVPILSLNKTDNSNDWLSVQSNITERQDTLSNETKDRHFRKSLIEGIDDNVKEVDDTVQENKIARKKRKSKIDAQSVEYNTESKIAEYSQVNKTKEGDKVLEKLNLTTIQLSDDLNLTVTTLNTNNDIKTDTTTGYVTFKSTNNNIKLDTTTEDDTLISTDNDIKLDTTMVDVPLKSTDNDIKLDTTTGDVTNTDTIPTTTVLSENITEHVTKTNPDDTHISTTVLLQSATDNKSEIITEKVQIQHTQMNDFDANENDTVSDAVTTANNETTTEEIVKVRTQFISGYPEDSSEDSTTISEVTDTTFGNTVTETVVTTDYPSNNITSDQKYSENQYNTSFYALKLSDKDDVKSSVANINTQKTEGKDLALIKTNTKNFDTKVKSEPLKENFLRQNVEIQNNEATVINIENPKDTPYITSTTIIPLTTAEIKQKELYYAMEASVEVQTDSVIKLKAHNDTKKQIPPQKTVKNAIRKGLKRIHGSGNPFELFKSNPSKKEYLVYEVLPGQEPFVKMEPVKPKKKRPQKLNPKAYPKLLKYKPKKKKALLNDLQSQIEQPNYAPVYNYAPEYAYYNPKNKYGPNSDDEEAKIVDERSNEQDVNDIEKIFDYEMPKRYPKHSPRSTKPLILQLLDKKPHENRISMDYYFGFLERSGKKGKHPLRSKNKDKCKLNKKFCKEPVVTVEQRGAVPPNSDEPQHAHNAMFHKNPPVTHLTQVKSILGDLGYFHHNHGHIHSYKCKKDGKYFHGSGETWLGPDLDLFMNKNVDKKRYIRSGDDHIKEEKYKPQIERFSAKINPRLIASNRDRLMAMNKTFGYKNTIEEEPKLLLTGRLGGNNRYGSKKNPLNLLTGAKYHERKHPMILLTGANYHERKNPMILLTGANYHERKNPMILLTGNLDKNSISRNKKNTLLLLTGRLNKDDVKSDKKDTLLLLTGGLNKDSRSNNKKDILLLLTGRLNKNGKNSNQNLNTKFKKDSVQERYHVVNRDSSENDYEIKKNNIKVVPKSNEMEYLDKRVTRSGSVEFEYNEPNDVLSTELKDLDPKVVNLILKLSEHEDDPKYQRNLLATMKSEGKLKKPVENPKKEIYKDKRPKLRSKNKIDAYVDAMKDMIQTNSTALQKYAWLSTTVDIRSALSKLLQLSDSIQKDSNDIHPKDLQLVKYIIYLYDTTRNLFDLADDVETISADVPEEFPSNLRFSYAEKTSAEKKTSLRFPVKRKSPRRSHVSARRYQQRPWLNKEGLEKKMADLKKFVEGLGEVLSDFHDAIKHIAIITNYRSQRWFENLKEVYLTDPPTRKQALEIVLHLATTRLISLIEESAANGLESNYVRYGISHPKEVENAKDEFAFVVKVYLALKKLQ